MGINDMIIFLLYLYTYIHHTAKRQSLAITILYAASKETKVGIKSPYTHKVVQLTVVRKYLVYQSRLSVL